MSPSVVFISFAKKIAKIFFSVIEDIVLIEIVK